MNLNVASQNQGVVAFSSAAAASPAIDVRNHVNFGFTFSVTAAITTAAVFKIQTAPPSAGNPCLPGTFVEVPEVLTCRATWGTVPAVTTTVTIPVGVAAGSVCSATMPCKPGAFIKVVAVSGDTAKVDVVAVLGGPMN